MRNVIIALLVTVASLQAAIPFDIEGPAGSDEFGTAVEVLPNGNIVVTDPAYDRPTPATANVGAVYLYSKDGKLISRVTGNTANDSVGSGGILVLESGNFVISSPSWDNGAATDAGAVTFGNASTGFTLGALGVVNATNSLIGTTAGDSVGSNGVMALSNGNYVVRSGNWNNGATTDAGAVTWGDGLFGTVGAVSASNSMVGTSANDLIGQEGLVELSGGNYVIVASTWNNGIVVDAGAVVWCNGRTPTTGAVSTSNALHGTSANDFVGSNYVWLLSNGNYIVASPNWNNGAIADVGAVTWCNGAGPTGGPVSTSNSLYGSNASDTVGSTSSGEQIIILKNGHYVICTPEWDNGAVLNVGAVTWCNGTTGTTGPVTAANSLIGQATDDKAGERGGCALSNGHYVVMSPSWDNGGVQDVGAVTWCNGTSATIGQITPANSLIGDSEDDWIGNDYVTPLTNGNYVVTSQNWTNGVISDAGAITWCNGTKTTAAVVSDANSLVGSNFGDLTLSSVYPLQNGNYVVAATNWNNGSFINAGAAIWGSGTKGIKGAISSSIALVGTSSNDGVGSQVIELRDGNYVVCTPSWNNGATSNVGAATWGNGTKGVKGPVTDANSLIGGNPDDFVGSDGALALDGGAYVVESPLWSGYTGAVTWSAKGGIKGIVSIANSLIGTAANDELGDRVTPLPNGDYAVFTRSGGGAVTWGNGAYGTVGLPSVYNTVTSDATTGANHLRTSRAFSRERIAIGRREENIVTLFGNYFATPLAKTGETAPGAPDTAFSTLGQAAVGDIGSVMCDYSLSGAGTAGGKSRAIFATAYLPYDQLDLVLRTGDSLGALEQWGFPTGSSVTAVSAPYNLRAGAGLIQATFKGNGVTSSSNKLIFVDTGAAVTLVARNGTPISALGGAKISSFTDIVQSSQSDFIALSYTLAGSSTPSVNSSSDSGILPIRADGGILNNNVSAREGSPAFGGGGTFGQFTGRAATGKNVVHFGAIFKPTSGSSGDAIFRMNEVGIGASRVALKNESPPDVAGDPDAATVKYSSFLAVTQQVGTLSEDVIFKAVLSNGDSARNEGIWRLPNASQPTDQRLVRKGDQVTGLASGIVFNSLQKFWPGDEGQIIILAKISGPGVTSKNNMVLVLRQADGNFYVLLRTGSSAAGIGNATIKSILAVDVEPALGSYVVLTSLDGATSASNQALWHGLTALGADTPAASQAERLPSVILRKGDRYSSALTSSAVIKSITLKPFTDSAGAGGRGEAHCVGGRGRVAASVLIDRNITELLLLP